MPGEVGTGLALRELHRKPGGLITNQVASPQTRQKQDVLLWHHQRLSLLTVSQKPRASTSHHCDLEPQVPTGQSHEPSQPPNTGHVFRARPTGIVQARHLLRTLGPSASRLPWYIHRPYTRHPTSQQGSCAMVPTISGTTWVQGAAPARQLRDQGNRETALHCPSYSRKGVGGAPLKCC